MKIISDAWSANEVRMHFEEPSGEQHWRLDVHTRMRGLAHSTIYTVSFDGWIRCELEATAEGLLYWLRKPKEPLHPAVASHLPTDAFNAIDPPLPDWVH